MDSEQTAWFVCYWNILRHVVGHVILNHITLVDPVLNACWIWGYALWYIEPHLSAYVSYSFSISEYKA